MKEQFLVTVSYTVEVEDKAVKRKEDYIVSGVSFTDIETKVNKELQHLINPSFLIQSIKREPITGFFKEFADVENLWYKVKVRTQDPDSEKVRFISYLYYVNAENTGKANDLVCDELAQEFKDFIVVSIAETKVVTTF